ncbi:Dihydrolipoyllysine-residue acetyltransferase component of pyruvate dehydrogenase complex [Piscirickettsia salmonis]|uniref:Acetyltransferase component of pyruvate dehydrogenase complex n=2 Tax=Piscirickettsia salmonis TaxID=1238 RepID=A0A1L6TG65_PISSA|nr:pyruvate dehydrogenase [Piscirickettsia salmonis LF-89 = ATCC VR-1361]ALB21396.1 pyruvate dehydrogenase [Piscirickettsia salmonis]ALY01631.1 pyruvate dehydrogenase complex dihydrolipoyllysine-residue acetyltransferase [Piscirickettsia salmonis]AMA41143.1 pyruvate dehydrogenase complex dihydrolipoyllysine-residue acetyltransferase [Piscirickettsia salmonis]AOS36332.1 pyruvate dehydrogenase [Piscirickettsia salmonis]
MATMKDVLVPDIGNYSDVAVIEINVAVGDQVSADDALITLETDKATMEVPAPFAGTVKAIKVKEGSKVSEGSLIVQMEGSDDVVESATVPAPVAAPTAVVAPTGPIEVRVPDIGNYSGVDVIEINVAVGDQVSEEDALITLETDKATMEVPSPVAGIVKEIKVAEGSQVSEGDLVLIVEGAGGTSAVAHPPATAQQEVTTISSAVPMAAVASASVQEVHVPDIGNYSGVDVIEINVAVGDCINEEDPLITLETDKATMEVPSPVAGVVKEIKVAEGSQVSEGDLIVLVESPGASSVVVSSVASQGAAVAVPAANQPVTSVASAAAPVLTQASGPSHASPALRRFANELGVDLAKVIGTGRKNRILHEDVTKWVKNTLSRPAATASAGGGTGLDLLPVPKVDFAKFGAIEEQPLSRIKKISGANLHRNWVMVPHVTQFDEADITEMEAFRKEQNKLAEKKKADYKFTPLAFLLKASAAALKAFPEFCASLNEVADALVLKKYVHIGVAVDTPNGLVVPVVQNVDQKGLVELSRELGEISKKARAGKLTAVDMQGGCFTISSLGGLGGTAFTPIVNLPEVAILGVSKSSIKPIWNGNDFAPRLMLPLSLSYDHRVIDGAAAARFTTFLAEQLSDLRNMLL